MLIVIPSLIILLIATMVVVAIKVFQTGKHDDHERKVIREKNLYNKNAPEGA
ncbi:MAG: hypothetical protein K2X86_00625 [Cytophagaceae bacterium]|nr:hypothetical protein [Cytophagaceae bacterium]